MASESSAASDASAACLDRSIVAFAAASGDQVLAGSLSVDAAAAFVALRGSWPTFPLEVDSRGDPVRSDRWYQAVAPAVLLLLHYAVPFLPLEHFEAQYSSPTAECVADVLRAIGASAGAETFLCEWRGCLVDPEMAETVHCLLNDAAENVAYPECGIFRGHCLTTAQRAKITLTFADIPTFAAKLVAVFDFARAVVGTPDEPSPAAAPT